MINKNKMKLIIFFVFMALMTVSAGCISDNNNSKNSSAVDSQQSADDLNPTKESLPAKTGDSVDVFYTGTTDDGVVFDKKVKGTDSPLSFTIGEKKMIFGFENAVLGMKEGETKTVRLSPDEAYGNYRDELIFSVEKSFFPEDYLLTKGNTEYLMQDNGGILKVVILNITDSKVVLDANHNLAGKNLTFEIFVEKINN